ncbi:MAG: hypothetical protein H6R04_1841 [Burkholderiaceae bacterium]|nr:hypothetical protein [Burkholderiaceae bacterium]
MSGTSRISRWKLSRGQIYFACIVFILLGCYLNEGKTEDLGAWIFPNRQFSSEIDVTNRSEQVFDIDIKRRCLFVRCAVSFGLEFVSKRGALKSDPADPVKNAHIKEYLFITRPGQPHVFRFPLDAHVKLLNAKSEIIFEETKHIGDSGNTVGGAPTITAKIGWPLYCLPSGKYKAVVQINQADQGMQEFVVKLVVANEFNFGCGKR